MGCLDSIDKRHNMSSIDRDVQTDSYMDSAQARVKIRNARIALISKFDEIKERKLKRSKSSENLEQDALTRYEERQIKHKSKRLLQMIERYQTRNNFKNL